MKCLYSYVCVRPTDARALEQVQVVLTNVIVQSLLIAEQVSVELKVLLRLNFVLNFKYFLRYVVSLLTCFADDISILI